MALAREGFLIIAGFLALAALCVLAGLWLGGVAGVVLIAIGLVSLGFSRDPKRFLHEGANALMLSPVLFKQIAGTVAHRETVVGHIPESRLGGAAASAHLAVPDPQS